MKKIITGLMMMLITSVSYAGIYKCTAYLDGAQAGPAIKVNASKTPIAETKAQDRMVKAGQKLDYVKCEKVK
ncbi:MAG TPA: hypothetical protein EYQ43_05550 [Methyloprofundus sp.]|uniref:hypothetical protein n=1 Tax=Methyloprofundus sp. TaxID=2020875 RepID=UPI0018247B52|nr:hypothetical protein [Methyloprofundus sp.]HIG65018.1 hypothetical protein [Methyloprofundus sp.]HIL77620.1 hypothetical protein [Methylococcales bacterium]